MAILKDCDLMGGYDVLVVWAGCDAMRCVPPGGREREREREIE
jgi:hypothetical protein